MLNDQKHVSKSAQAAITKHYRLGDFNNIIYFLTVLRSGCQYGWILGESLFPGLQTAIFSLYSHIVERRSKLLYLFL